MTLELKKSHAALALALSTLVCGRALAAPSVQDALSLEPSQKDVQIERPEAAAIPKCTIKSEGKRGWVVRDPNGQILRIFADSDGDNVVDQWSYFKDGVEVYRDIDTNKNKKPDQCRWLNTGGSRWGVDTNEDGKVDYWKTISPEEVTAELVAAIRDRDKTRFERIALSAAELKALGLGSAKQQMLQKKLDIAMAGFGKLAGTQKLITPQTKWASFGGSQPGVVPAGTEDSTADITVYENVMAMVETDGADSAKPLSVGTLVKVKDTWRVVDLPNLSDDSPEPLFFTAPRSERSDQALAGVNGKPSEEVQKLMEELNNLGEISPSSTAEQHEKRAELLKKLAGEAEGPENKAQWLKQLADSLSAAVQTSNYEPGIGKLKELYESLKDDPESDELASYVQFRFLTSEHGHELAQPNPPFQNIQDKWVENLTKFVQSGKKTPECAEAMMELAISHEFGGSEEKALQWYESIVKDFPESPVYRKASGAKLRLTSIGKTVPLKGKLLTGQSYDLNSLKGKAVLIQYWATWCEPAKSDMPLLKELRTKYKDLEVVGVCLDNNKQDMLTFLKASDPKWPQLFEEGGLDNRFANELGIQTLPTMILIDKQGKVVNRNIRAEELDTELKRVLK